MEGGPNGKPHCVPRVLQNIGKEAVVDEIRLDAEARVAEKIKIDASSETVKGFPVDFTARRCELCDNSGGKGVGRMRSCLFVNSADRWPDEDRNGLEVPDLQLGSSGERLGGGTGRNTELIAGRKHTDGLVRRDLAVDLGSESRFE